MKILNYARRDRPNRDWVIVATFIGVIVLLIAGLIVIVQMHLRGYPIF
jgi:hypothetical protein